MKKLILLLGLLPVVSFAQEKNKVKNVILLIGDGMGLSQMSTIYYYNDGKMPNFSRFRHIGLMNTSSATEKITDSAAGATAFATGTRSYNGAISVDTNKKDLPTIIEIIEKIGIKSGLIATSSITHATPACFYAHVESRSMHEEIARHLSQSAVDFFAGGGLRFFTQRSDKINYYTQLLKKGFEIDTVKLDMEEKFKPGKKYGYFVAENGLDSKLNGRGDFLKDATDRALTYLSKAEKGFFLMVEGSQIDWEGHDMNSEGIIEEVKDFDKAIGEALDFAEVDGNTLVIVTADHETGGYALSPAYKDGHYDYNSIEPTFYEGANEEGRGSSAHTTTLIPVFAYGPGADQFMGIYKNTEIFHKIMKVTKWSTTYIDSPKEPRDDQMERRMNPINE